MTGPAAARRKAPLASIGLAVGLLLGFAAGGAASEAATQTVRMIVTEASVFDVPPPVVTLSAGSVLSSGGPAQARGSYLAHYTILGSGKDNCVLTAELSCAAPMPAGSSLALEVKPPHRGPSPAGRIDLSATARSVLAIPRSSATGTGKGDGAHFTYRLAPSRTAAPDGGSDPRPAVILTLTET